MSTKTFPLSLLLCPRCGGKLEMFLYSFDPHYGLLRCGCGELPIVHSIPKPLAVVVCYPSNPTAYVADLDFYKELVAFAKKHGIFILSDLAYAELYFENNPPPSVLQVPGAIDIAVEFTLGPP